MLSGILGFLWDHWGWFAGGGGILGTAALALIPGAGPVLAIIAKNWKVIAIGLAIIVPTGLWLWERDTRKDRDLEIVEMQGRWDRAIADANDKATKQINEANAKAEAASAALKELREQRDKEQADRDTDINAAADSTVCLDQSGAARAYFGLPVRPAPAPVPDRGSGAKANRPAGGALPGKAPTPAPVPGR